MSDKITLQKIFDLAWEHFIVGDGEPAWSKEKRRCQYLTEDGRKCAVGLALPEGHSSQQAHKGFLNLCQEYPELFDESVHSARHYLNDFQRHLHDQLIAGGEWLYSKEKRRQGYIQVARDFGLTVPGGGNV